jgi:hypothetical protein
MLFTCGLGMRTSLDMPRGTDRYDEARLQGRLWTPDVLRGPNLKQWFEALDFSGTIATGVSQWNDLSGNGFHATQPTALNQPTWLPSGLNGRPTLYFNGGMALASTPSTITSTTLAAFVVASMSASTMGYGRLISAAGGPGGNDFDSSFAAALICRYDTNQQILSYRGLAPIVGRNVLAYDSPFQASIIYDGTNATMGINYDVDFSSASSGTFSIGAAYIGNHTGAAGATWTGTCSAYILVAGVLPPADRHKIEGYLAWRYGLPLRGSHPFSNRPPLIGD